MKMGELNVEIEICCRAEFITYACEILRKSVKVFCRFLNFFTERGEKRVSGFQSIFLVFLCFILKKYQSPHYTDAQVMSSPVFPSLDDIYGIFLQKI